MFQRATLFSLLASAACFPMVANALTVLGDIELGETSFQAYVTNLQKRCKVTLSKSYDSKSGENMQSATVAGACYDLDFETIQIMELQDRITHVILTFGEENLFLYPKYVDLLKQKYGQPDQQRDTYRWAGDGWTLFAIHLDEMSGLYYVSDRYEKKVTQEDKKKADKL